MQLSERTKDFTSKKIQDTKFDKKQFYGEIMYKILVPKERRSIITNFPIS